jgi:YfiH family protein
MSPQQPSQSKGTITVLGDPALARLEWLIHGFSTRKGGVSRSSGSGGPSGELNLAGVQWDRAANVEENRRRFLKALGAAKVRLVLQQQIHSDLIRSIDSPLEQGVRGDGLLTRKSGLLLGVVAADCLPVLLVDVRKRVVGAVHAGWRGTVRRIAEKAVGRMRMLYGSLPEDLRAAIGPGIHACCYQIGEDVAAEFENQFVYAEALLRTHRAEQSALEKKYPLLLDRWRGPRPQERRTIHLDLVEANLRQLQEAGLARERIWQDTRCTSCHPELFFSHRRDAARAGRMLGVVGIRPS